MLYMDYTRKQLFKVPLLFLTITRVSQPKMMVLIGSAIPKNDKVFPTTDYIMTLTYIV